MHSNIIDDKQQKDDLGRDLFLANKYLKLLDSDDETRLEIRILFTSEEYQDVEILYKNKKRRRRITKFLPQYFASNFEELRSAVTNDDRPSGHVGATNLGSLSRGGNLVLQEKFLRILAKINHVSEIKTAEKIWDSEERISTSDKTILLAVVNSILPEGEKIDRSIISQRSYEVVNRESFEKLINTALDLTRDSKKLASFLFGDAMKKLGEKKQSYLTGCLRNILSELDESKSANQIKFLGKILEEVVNARSNSSTI